MSLHRIVVNAQTGEVERIEQTAYRNASGEVRVLDNGEPVPSGFTPMTEEELHAYNNPPMTEEQMKQAEIAQDKQYLADTDWIIAKIGEASLTGQDTAPLLTQYATQLQAREEARIRIRINEGRA
jgi:hypothetical protein